MELFATTVEWGDKTVTVYDKTQSPKSVEIFLKLAFRLFRRKVRVVSSFVGGAFGLGLRPQQSVFLAVLAAKALKRSIRLVIPRDQMFALGYRANSIQTVSLGADKNGHLLAVRHRAIAATSRNEDAQDPMLNFSASLYRCHNVKLAYELAKLDTVSPCDMRAPGAATGMFALECAMDELAYATNVDPLVLRLANYTERDQSENRPFSSKALRECYAQGAERFGWAKRSHAPRSMRKGKELVGWGMATGVWEAAMSPVPARAKVRLLADGRFEVTSSITDIGTGTYTILTQIAADALEASIERVVVKLGDSALPFNPIQGGSWTAATSGSAVQAACNKLKKKILSRAKQAGIVGNGQSTELLSPAALADLLRLSDHDNLSATATIINFPFGKNTRVPLIQQFLPRSASMKSLRSFGSPASYARSPQGASSILPRPEARSSARRLWALAKPCTKTPPPTTIWGDAWLTVSQIITSPRMLMSMRSKSCSLKKLMTKPVQSV